ncbi:MAG: hypothetical protein DMF15_12295 [Verrucomicrobia bacterium]|nr:MAG: hypothetical protein DMF15_12295 [Verrucomicrobiota bacterium]
MAIGCSYMWSKKTRSVRYLAQGRSRTKGHSNDPRRQQKRSAETTISGVCADVATRDSTIVKRSLIAVAALTACGMILAQTDDNLVRVQNRLKAEGLFFGDPTGVLDAQTKTALALYQIDHHLTVTGQLDAPTARELDASPQTPMFTPTPRQSPTPTGTPSATATPTPRPTPTATPTATPIATPTSTPTPTPTPSLKPSPTPTATPTAALTPRPTPSVTPTATPIATPTSTPTPTPTPTPRPSPTATATPSATTTPTPRPTPSVTPTATPIATPTSTPRPTPTPTPIASPPPNVKQPPPRGSLSGGDTMNPDSLRDYVEAFVQAGLARPVGSELKFFAERVNYFGAPNVARQQIQRDLVRYNKKWPHRRFWIDGDVQFERQSGNEIKLLFPLRYELRNGSRHASGKVLKSLTLVKTADNEMQIVAVNESKAP